MAGNQNNQPTLCEELSFLIPEKLSCSLWYI
jgi:hypothetical protein